MTERAGFLVPGQPLASPVQTVDTACAPLIYVATCDFGYTPRGTHADICCNRKGDREKPWSFRASLLSLIFPDVVTVFTKRRFHRLLCCKQWFVGSSFIIACQCKMHRTTGHLTLTLLRRHGLVFLRALA